MKILYITKDALPLSGWGRQTMETVKGIIANDETVQIDIASEKGVETHSTLYIHPSTSTWNIVKNIWKFFKFRNTYDVYHAADLWPYGLYAFFATIWTKKKCIINGIGTYSVAPLDKKITGAYLRYIYKRSDAIICISKYTKTQIDARIPGAYTQVVHMGLTEMNTVTENPHFLEVLGITTTDFPVLVTVGEVKSRKGQLYTAQAVAQLKHTYPHIKYLMVCNTFSKPYVEELQKVDATLGGGVIIMVNNAKGDAELKTLYKRADIFALNSVNNDAGHFEGFGLVILEANQFGTPAIGSSGCGIEESIQNGVNGYLCTQKDVNDIVAKIEAILTAKSSNLEFWKDRCTTFAHSFSWNQTGKEYLKIYKKD